MLLAILPFVLGCGSDDDEPNPTDMKKELLTVGNASRPEWTAPDYTLFELPMSVQFRLQDLFDEYVSDNDLLCAFINDEVRAVTSPEDSEGQIYFPLVIAANPGESMVSIAYYCDQLHRIYTITDWHKFDTGMPPTNNGEPYILEFITTEQQ